MYLLTNLQVLIGLSAFKPQCSAEPRFSDSDMRFSEHNKNLTLDFEMSVTLIVFKTIMYVRELGNRNL